MNIKPTRKQLISRARKMRKNPTSSERLLWSRLRRRQVADRKFRRQHVLHPFIVDFYCNPAQLVVEIDGSSHYDEDAQERDQCRTELLMQHHRVDDVLRFSHLHVLDELDEVVWEIWEAVSE